MSMPSDPEPARRSRLDDVLAEYMECVDRGEAGVRERLLAEHPDLAGELAAYFAGCDELEWMDATIRVRSGSPVAAPADGSATTPDRRGGEAATSPAAR